MVKKFKKNFGVLIISFLILSFIYNHNLFRKFYNILFQKYESRLFKNYEYCSGESIGFLKMLKKKYKFSFNPKIINYDIVPNSNWSIYDTYKKTDTKHTIFLNYPEKLFFRFDRKDNKFFTNKKIQHSNGISSIVFNLKDEQIKINSKIKIYKKLYNKKEIIYEKNFDKLIINNQKISLNLKTKKLNSTWEPIIIEISDLNDDEIIDINNITLNLDHEFKLKNYQIIEQFNNCYYVK